MSLNSELSQSATGAARTPDVANDLGLSDMPLLLQYLTSLVVAGLATAVAAGFDRYETIPNLSLIYVLPVVASSVAFGLGQALFSALLGALAYNFFFTEPRFSLAVADTANIWAIVLLFVIGCITSTLVSSNRRDKSELDRVRLQMGKLKAYTRQMIAATSVEQAKSITRATLADALQRPVAIIYIGPDDEVEVVSDSSLTDMEIDAARAASGSERVGRGGCLPLR